MPRRRACNFGGNPAPLSLGLLRSAGVDAWIRTSVARGKGLPDTDRQRIWVARAFRTYKYSHSSLARQSANQPLPNLVSLTEEELLDVTASLATGANCSLEPMNRVIHGPGGRKLDRPIAKPIQHAARGTPVVHLPDVMDPNIPGKSIPAERLRESAGSEVLLQDIDLQPTTGQRAGTRQAADSGADHNSIDFILRRARS